MAGSHHSDLVEAPNAPLPPPAAPCPKFLTKAAMSAQPLHSALMSSSPFLRFLNESDEKAFLDEKAVTTYSMITTCAASTFVLAFAYTLLSADIVPLAATPLFLPALFADSFKHSPVPRLVALWTFAAYINLRLSCGVLMFSATIAPPTVQSGYALPYALVGPTACISIGTLLGLRFVRDVLPPVLVTLVTSVAHSVVVLRSGGGGLHYPIATIAVTLLGCATEYQNEYLERQRWVSLPDLKSCKGSLSNNEIAKMHFWQHIFKFMEFPSKADEDGYVTQDMKSPEKVRCGLGVVMFMTTSAYVVVKLRNNPDRFPVLSAVAGLMASVLLCTGTMHSIMFRRYSFILGSLYVLSQLLNSTYIMQALQNNFDDVAPAAARDNHPVPYALLGVPILMYAGPLMNLRPAKDCTILSPPLFILVFICFTLTLFLSPLAPPSL